MRGPRACGLMGLVLMLAGGPADAAAPPRPGAGLDELLAEYRALGLPLPPKGARLVHCERTGQDFLPPIYPVAFLLREGSKKGPHSLLFGTLTFSRDASEVKVKAVEPKPATIKVDMGWEEGLFFAIQCHSAGWSDLARHLMAQRHKVTLEPARPILRQAAWYYWARKIPEAGSDRAAVAKRLKALTAADKDLTTEYHRALVKSLEAALVPSKAKPGSVEALIDDLVEYDGRTGTVGLFEPGDRYQRIARLGFKAVPALIEHLDDDRLTRSVMKGFNNFPSWHMRVGDMVGDLLQDLAGDELERDWLRRQQGYPVKKANALKWWSKAHEVGEETYFLGRIFLKNDEGKVWVNPTAVGLVAHRYPKHLSKLYRTLLDKHPNTHGWDLAEAIARSSLPRKEKLDLLRYGAGRKSLTHRREALFQLKDIDKATFVKAVIETLDALPKEPKGPYWWCEEASFAAFVPLTDDPRAWRALEKAATRAGVGLRMQLLNNVDRLGVKRPGLRERHLGLFASFLDDASVRDEKSDPEKYEGPFAGPSYPRLEVRNFAAMEMASLLGIKVELNPDRSPKEWAALRAKVKDAWKREREKAKPKAERPTP